MSESRMERRRAEAEATAGPEPGAREAPAKDVAEAPEVDRKPAKKASRKAAAKPARNAGSGKTKRPSKRSDATRKDTAVEIERDGEIEDAVRRRKASAKPKKILIVPDEHMAEGRAAMRKHQVGGTIKNLDGTKTSRVLKTKKKSP